MITAELTPSCDILADVPRSADITTPRVRHSVFAYRVGEFTTEDAAIISRMKLATLVNYINAHDADIHVMHSLTLPCFLRKQAC